MSKKTISKNKVSKSTFTNRDLDFAIGSWVNDSETDKILNSQRKTKIDQKRTKKILHNIINL